MDNSRLERINSEIKKAISTIIAQEIRDPRVSGVITVVDVDTSNDLSHTKVAVSVYKGDKTSELKSFNALQHSAGFIRTRLAKMVDLRIVPEIHFKLDHGLDEVEKMNKILSKLDIPKEESNDEA